MRRTPLLLAAAATGSLLLAGCGSTATTPSAGAAPVSVQPAAATEGAVELADGLLPAEEFAPGADVTPVDADQFARVLGQGTAAGPAPAGVSVTPEACVTALDTARAAVGDPAAVQDAAGQVARSGFAASAELLTVGGPADTVVGTLTAAVAACPTATVTTPMGDAVVTFGPVGTPALGDAAAVVPVSATVTRPGAAPLSAAALVGVVSDGDRVLTLVSGGLAATPDAVVFEELLTAAQQHAVDTLG